MLNSHKEKTASGITKHVVASILFSSFALGLLGGLVVVVKSSANPIPTMLFGFVMGFFGGVLANLDKIKVSKFS